MLRYLQVRYSDDGCRNWSNWRDMPSGDTGSFTEALVIRRVGRTRDRTWETLDTSQAPQDIVAASIIVE